eukprot:CAMPEP_0172490186 /NCGR_PEP_ID=MMETSP1066-20121228/20506_1 /TAXON_ID=671091 /ORGANISM="Coscinodiscus wailesii, Strain CCMP2513" /LENGTH=37 /DNA_ID= /DNA_START= /DNA_END= /DNA_ORIENTATION=
MSGSINNVVGANVLLSRFDSFDINAALKDHNRHDAIF